MSKVSVIITTYGRDITVLEKALNSVIKQTHEDIEILIIDDNGLNTALQQKNASFVDSLNNKKVKYIPLKYNSGAQVARNTGILNVSGEYVAFLDDDDEWYDNKIERQLKVFNEERNNKLGLVYCWYDRFKEVDDNTYHKMTIELPEYSRKDVLKEMTRRNYVGSTSFPLIKTIVFNTVGYFDEELQASQDYDIWIRIAQSFDIKCLKKPLGAYYIHKNERITNDSKKKANAEIAFLNKHLSLIKLDRLSMSNRHKSIGIYLMRLGMGRKARQYFRVSIKNKPIQLRVYKYYIESYFLQFKLSNRYRRGSEK